MTVLETDNTEDTDMSTKIIPFQPITTYWHAATDAAPEQIIAAAPAGSVIYIVNPSDKIKPEDRHALACQKLVDKLGWIAEYYGHWYGSPTSIHGDKYVFVAVRKQDLINGAAP